MSTILLSLDPSELTALLAQMGQPAYRSTQIREWLLRGVTPEEMTNLPQNLRKALAEQTVTGLPSLRQKLVSALDGTIKYLFELQDGQCVESVFMRYHHGNTVCLSTQAGCRMGCRFCASTIGGFARNLQPYEILGQILAIQRDTGERVSGIVLMGIGEPLDNYVYVLRFLKEVSAPDGLNISCRHISLSTCGLADRILQLAEENLPITLSVSLHAATDEERSAVMPINRRYPIDRLLSACRVFFEKTGRRVSFEYALIDGQNDTPAHARRLAALLRRYFPEAPCHVNLIPINPVRERDYRRSTRANSFRDELLALHLNATIRRHLGADIHASCGQLRRQQAENSLKEHPGAHSPDQ